jgi:DNA modification methylase
LIQIIHADVIEGILIELNAEYIKIARERLRLNEQLGAFA